MRLSDLLLSMHARCAVTTNSELNVDSKPLCPHNYTNVFTSVQSFRQ